jgi:hypothetical protein
MLAIFGYLGAAAALFAGAALGLMVLVGESTGLGMTLGAYSDAKIAAAAKPLRTAAAGLDASAASRTTGQASSERPPEKQVRPKAPKNRSAHVDKRRKRVAHDRR